MTEDQIERIVAEVLRRMKQKVLLVLTDAGGYKREINRRLSACQQVAFSVLIATDATKQHCAERWQKIGPLLSFAPSRLPQLKTFDAVLVPFLDFKTLGHVAHGIIQDEATQLISHALMSNIPVFAFDYNCNPLNELNRLLGLHHNPGYCSLMQENQHKASQYGVNFVDFDQFQQQMSDLTSLSTRRCTTEAVQKNNYITLQDIIEKRVTQFDPAMKLTDLAIEYLKQRNR